MNQKRNKALIGLGVIVLVAIFRLLFSGPCTSWFCGHHSILLHLGRKQSPKIKRNRKKK